MADPVRTRNEVLERLVVDGVLTADQAQTVARALDDADTPTPGPPQRDRGPAGWLVEVGGYVGGGLMLGGIALLLATSWNDLGRAARIGVLVGLAVLFALAAVVAAGGPRAVRRLATGTARHRLVSVLFALAAAPAAAAVGQGAHRYEATLAFLVGFLVALAGLVWLPSVAGVVATAATSTGFVVGFGDDVLHATSLVQGLLLLGLGVVWTVAALVRVVRPRWLGVAVGAVLAISGAQLPIGQQSGLAYGLTAAVAVAALVLYRWHREVVLLVTGVVGMTIAVPEAVSDLTDGAVSGSVILLVAGAVLVATSVLGLRLRAATG
jgi:hypothetical protein